MPRLSKNSPLGFGDTGCRTPGAMKPTMYGKSLVRPKPTQRKPGLRKTDVYKKQLLII